jgi:membrane protease YdiL (CAAX protease family)
MGLVGLQAAFFTVAGLAIFHQTDRPLAWFVTFDQAGLVGGLALALALILASMTLSALFPAYAQKLIRDQAHTYSFLKNRAPLPAVLFISLCAGIGEEALFRGGLQTWLGGFMSGPLALVLAALAFALIHFAKARVGALIFIIGCLFGWVYWYTGSLLTVMVGHALYDVYALWALQRAMRTMDLAD